MVGMRGYPLIGIAVLLFVLFAIAARSLVTGSPSPTKATGASARPTAVESSCATRLLRDWGDGRIDEAYPLVCYRAALKSLPTDLQVYSSAPEDISQALSQRIVKRAQQRSARTTAGK